MVAIADEKQGDEKLKLIRQISGLADGITQKYVESLSETINDPEASVEEKAKAFGEMDKVLRVAKQYSDRVLLAEGKATENLGVGGMPFNVIITKTYEQKPDDVSQQSEVTTDETDEHE
ncbi:MAG: hypothetical protein J7M40_13740 [Planctomycetes bacterium]|nr:hypothetical protein [Planctomycetota bacterium]